MLPDQKRPDPPCNLETIPNVDCFPSQRHRWNTNEEIAALLIRFERHENWLSREVKIRPKSGSMLLYSRKRAKYRRDGYCWKKRKDGKTTREDHMKLKVQGTECIYGCYVHSAVLPTFHRRCYWLLQNPDIVLVHYLNVPYSDDNKIIISPSLSYCTDKREWTKEELVLQVKPMFSSENEPVLNNELESSQTAETVEAIVQQLMEKQRTKMAIRTHECSCDTITPSKSSTASGSVIGESRKCSHTLRRIISPKTQAIVTGVPTGSKNIVTTSMFSSASAQTSVSQTVSHKRRTNIIRDTTTVSTPTVSQHPSGVTFVTPCRSLVQDGTSEEEDTVLTASSKASDVNSDTTTSPTASLILNLCRLQGSGGLLILNSAAVAASMGLNSSSLTPVTLLCGQEVSAALLASTTAASIPNPNSMDTPDSSSSSTPKCTFEIKPQSRVKLSSCLKDEATDFGSNVSTNKDPNLSHALHDFTLDLDGNLTLLHDVHRTSSNLLSTSPPYIKTEPINHPDLDPVDLTPMDFIDNDLSTPDDEVFNLDTFDMLTDLPNLEDLHSDLVSSSGLVGCCGSLSGVTSASKNHHQNPPDIQDVSQHITDYSPHWSYTDGGVKVLITGPWNSGTSIYTAIFDGVSAPTTLVQNGVLRCFCPAHESGMVTLQVACQGIVVSNSVAFEYRKRSMVCVINEQDWFSVDEHVLKFSLLERLEMMETKMIFELQEPAEFFTQVYSDKQRTFEDRLVVLCHRLMSGAWTQSNNTSQLQVTSHFDLTLLHLASALGYSRLVCTLLYWRTDNPSLVIASEVDALSRDKNMCTPLLWACARGHREVALLLYQWNGLAVKIQDSNGNDPLTVARNKGYHNLAEDLEQVQFQESISGLSPKSSTPVRNNSKSVCPSLSTSTDLSSLSSLLMNPIPNIQASISTNQSVSHKMLTKQFSVDSSLFLPGLSASGDTDKHSVSSKTPLLPCNDHCFSLPSSTSNIIEESSVLSSKKTDTGERLSSDESPYIDVVDEGNNSQAVTAVATGSLFSSRPQSCRSCDLNMADTENQVLSLAEKIIAAIPDRIKASSGELSDLMNVKNKANLQPTDGRISNNISTQDKSSLELCSVKEPQPPLMSEEFSFEFSDHNYRYHEVGTPNSSSSTTSSCLQSPVSFTLESNSLPPTTADFCEFFQASGKIMERDFSNLTLSDREQRELYEAAKIIQKAYRSYKGRKRQEEQEKEKAAAILIQSYYRRYKQYLYYKETTRAVQVIQNQYRNYCELKKLKKSQGLSTSSNAGTGGRQSPSPSFLSLYKTNGNGNNRLSSSNCEGTPTSDFNTRRTYSQRSQNQAAKKIQQFMRHSKNNVWDLLHGRVIAGRTCISCRKREASGGSNEPAATVPKISGTAF